MGRDVKSEIELVVTYSRPEDSPKRLAIRLAHHLTLEQAAKNDAAAFRAQAASENVKAKQMGDTLIRLSEYNRQKARALKAGDPWKVSRMEPMEHFEEGAIKLEKQKYIGRVRELNLLATESDDIAKNAARETASIQRLLAAS